MLVSFRRQNGKISNETIYRSTIQQFNKKTKENNYKYNRQETNPDKM